MFFVYFPVKRATAGGSQDPAAAACGCSHQKP
jgi:hypothetical protein